jgi:ribosomal protein S18 acetylase RimI-like enzyme
MRTIRKADTSDADNLSRLAELTFRETFGGANTAADMDSHCSRAYARAVQAAEIADSSMCTILSTEGHEILGYAQMRWGVAPKCVVAHSPGEIQRLYVAKTHHGAGIAHELMHACISEMISRRTDLIWLGVWERNPRAIAFYRKFAFEEVGDHVFTLGSDKQRDIIMTRLSALPH